MLRKMVSRFLDLNQKELDRLEKTVGEINLLEGKTKKLSETKFRLKTKEFKERLKKGEELEELKES